MPAFRRTLLLVLGDVTTATVTPPPVPRLPHFRRPIFALFTLGP